MPVLGRDRIDADAAYEILDELRAELVDSPTGALNVMDAIDDVLFGASSLPFTSNELVDGDRLLGLIAELRSRLADSPQE